MAAKCKSKRIPLQKLLWCKIRYWQNLHDVSNDELADFLGCSTRTLLNYDNNPSNVTLKMMDKFLYMIDMSLTEFLSTV